ncbi:MAG: hypothetical protein A2X59_03065 [Nitrospirae bacterium GWC2_42_7]|nr:MAG: hypothetical protein A2X59_03065 [Nitrospirae bacterium GWC2_42_7]
MSVYQCHYFVIPAKPEVGALGSGYPDVVPLKKGNQKKYWLPVFTGNPGFPTANFGNDRQRN